MKDLRIKTAKLYIQYAIQKATRSLIENITSFLVRLYRQSEMVETPMRWEKSCAKAIRKV